MILKYHYYGTSCFQWNELITEDPKVKCTAQTLQLLQK